MFSILAPSWPDTPLTIAAFPMSSRHITVLGIGLAVELICLSLPSIFAYKTNFDIGDVILSSLLFSVLLILAIFVSVLFTLFLRFVTFVSVLPTRVLICPT